MVRPLDRKRRIDDLLSKFDQANLSLSTEERELQKAINLQRLASELQALVQRVAEETQNQVHHQVASIVSDCLRSVFEQPYEFKIHFEQKRGKTEARMVFIRDGEEIDPMSASGGGVIDITAFALRLACIILARPSRRRFLILDEPFKFVSREYRPKLQSLLENLSERAGFQFLIVTHIPEFQLGNVVEL